MIWWMVAFSFFLSFDVSYSCLKPIFLVEFEYFIFVLRIFIRCVLLWMYTLFWQGKNFFLSKKQGLNVHLILNFLYKRHSVHVFWKLNMGHHLSLHHWYRLLWGLFLWNINILLIHSITIVICNNILERYHKFL